MGRLPEVGGASVLVHKSVDLVDSREWVHDRRVFPDPHQDVGVHEVGAACRLSVFWLREPLRLNARDLHCVEQAAYRLEQIIVEREPPSGPVTAPLRRIDDVL
jgi:hypothetical protein